MRLIGILVGITYPALALGVVLAYLRGDARPADPGLALFMIGMISAIVWSMLVVATWTSVRRRARHWRENAHGFMRVDLGGAAPSAAAAAIDHALRSFDSGFVTERPPPEAVAQWSHVVGDIRVVFWHAVRGGLPLLEVKASSHPEAVARAKGRIEQALYGP